MTGPGRTIAQLLGTASGQSVARLDAEVLLAQALQRPRAWLHAWPEHRCSPAQTAACEALLARRAAGVPVAYLTGEREFWSLNLNVNASTLIPRADTETLVERALALPLDGPTTVRVLDLGTGSGAIALALASERPTWRITATDRHRGALRVADDNARRLQLSIDLREGDWWQAIHSHERFHLIVSNPPYLRADDHHLGLGDLRHEPQQALVGGDDGLGALRVIVDGARQHLHRGGWLVVEHGYDQGAPVRALFAAAGFMEVATVRDLGANERLTLGRSFPDE